MQKCPACGATYEVAEGFCPLDGARLVPVRPPLRETSQGSGPGGDNDPLLGRTLDGRYRVEERVGAGGMGVVYRATHVVIRKAVAIKILRPSVAKKPDVVKRFLLEAQLASKLKHPNVVDISDYGQLPEGGAYLVMEYLRGQTLGKVIQDSGSIAPARALTIAKQVASALGVAHEQGVVHRDLKPDNVFIGRADDGSDRPKILDFGIARVTGRKTRLTATGAVVGTPEYMSPEQAQGRDVDSRADLYALGIIFFEMLVGKVPLKGKTVAETLTKQIFEAAPTLSEVSPALSAYPHLQRCVDRLTAKDRDERPADPAAAERMLAEALAELEGRVAPAPAPSAPPSGRAGAQSTGPRATVPLGSLALDGEEGSAPAASAAASVRAAHPAAPGPAASAAASVSMWRSGGGGGLSDTSGFDGDDDLDMLVAPTRSVPGWVTGAAIGALIAAVGVGAWAKWGRDRGDTPAAPEGSAAAPVAAQAAPAPPAPAPAAPAAVQLRIESTPPGASVRVGSRELGVTPFTAMFPPGTPVNLEFSREGHTTQTHALTPEIGAPALRVELEPARRKRTKTPRGRSRVGPREGATPTPAGGSPQAEPPAMPEPGPAQSDTKSNSPPKPTVPPTNPTPPKPGGTPTDKPPKEPPLSPPPSDLKDPFG